MKDVEKKGVMPFFSFVFVVQFSQAVNSFICNKPWEIMRKMNIKTITEH